MEFKDLKDFREAYTFWYNKYYDLIKEEADSLNIDFDVVDENYIDIANERHEEDYYELSDYDRWFDIYKDFEKRSNESEGTGETAVVLLNILHSIDMMTDQFIAGIV